MSNEDQQPEATVHDVQVSALYQRTRKSEPPASLDAAILAAAHREVAARPQSANASAIFARWRVPLALAATVVLGFSVVTLISQYQEPTDKIHIAMVEMAPNENSVLKQQQEIAPPRAVESDRPMQESVAQFSDAQTAPAAPSIRELPKKSARLKEAKTNTDARVALVQPLESEITDRLSKPEPTTPPIQESRRDFAPSGAVEKKAQSEEVVADLARDKAEQAEAVEPHAPVKNQTTSNSQDAARVMPEENTRAEKAANPSAAMAGVGAADRHFERQRQAPSLAKEASKIKPIGLWLKEIAKLRVDGRIQEAAQQLQQFKQAYPDVPEEKISTSLAAYEREFREGDKVHTLPENDNGKK